MLLSDTSKTFCYLDFIKNLTINDCVNLAAEVWDKVSESTLFKAWNKVYTTKESAEDGELNGSSEAEVSHSPLLQELETA